MNTEKLIHHLFQAKIVAPYQREIVESILFKQYEHVQIMASRQSGKSWGVGWGVTLLGRFGKREDILLIAPTQKQARVIYDYVLDFIKRNPVVYNAIEINKSRKIENLGDEISKSEITFTIKDEDGNSLYKNRISIMTAGKNAKMNTLLGQSPTTIVLDESQGIPDEVYYNVIMPMLATEKDVPYTLVELGTPHIRGHFFKTHLNEKVKKIRVTCWQAIEAGIQRREFIESQKKELSTEEFAVWYEAEFPDEDEDSLFTFKEVENGKASKDIKDQEDSIKLLSCDIARYGRDLTVLRELYYQPDTDEYQVGPCHVLKEKGVNVTTGKVMALDRDHEFDHILVDDTGIGGGVTDILQEQLGKKVIPVVFGSTKMSDKEKRRYLNLKAKLYYRLKYLLQHGQIYDLTDTRLIEELHLMKKEFQSNGKVKIIDPDKSPDFADSLVIGLHKLRVKTMATGTYKSY